jgi:hypothetical protein
MSMKPMSLWDDYVSHLKLYLASAERGALVGAWERSANRTEFYRVIALRESARAMGYEFDCELYKVDFVMWKKVDAQKVPVIFIESENDAMTATHEIRKLCCIAAPLRILITVVEWDESKGVWLSGGYRSPLLAEWQSVVRAYNSVWPRPGLIGLIVGEWRPDNVLRFYANAIDPDGVLVGPDKVVFERNMTSSDIQLTS